MKHISISFSAFFLLAAFLASGCKYSPTGGGTTSTNVTPKTGSSYTYAYHHTDASGNQVGADSVVKADVVSSGDLKFGQSNVYTVIDNGDTSYYTYAANGDVLAYIENSGAPAILKSAADKLFQQWITLPVVSHTTGVIVHDSTDVTAVLSGNPIAAKAHMVVDYIGSDSVTTSTGKLFVQQCLITITATSNSLFVQPPITATYQRNFYFAPKIGYFGQEKTHMIIPPVPLVQYAGSNSGTVQTLTTYDVK